MNELLINYMVDIAFPFFASKDAEVPQKAFVVKSKVALGLTILRVIFEYGIPASKIFLDGLCSLLCLDEKSEQAIQGDLHQIKKAFEALPGYVCYWVTN